jgi:ATP-dependent DNA helicase RecG
MKMKSLQLSSSIENAPLINEKRGKVLRDHGVRTIEDLLWYLPFRYEDWRKLSNISEAKNGQAITIAGTVTRVNLQITARQRFRILDITIRDSTGAALLRFFNQPYLKDQFEKGKRVVVHGVAQKEPISPGPLIKDPQYEFVKSKDLGELLQLRPVYERIGVITPKMLRYIIRTCLEALPAGTFGEPLSQKIRDQYHLIDRKSAFVQLHFPGSETTIEELDARRSQGHRRLIFEEFYLLELGLAYRRKERPKKAHRIDIDDRIRKKIKEALPFRLTNAQKKVIREIVEDMKADVVMYRLLQGDVGSGKTIVALMAAMVAIENGLQVAIMAPTEILAEQHFSKIRQILRNTTYVVRLLRGGQKRKDRSEVLDEIATGACHLVIGTHALIQDPVLFKRLGLVIIDEQHRFGVLQREKLLLKGQHPDCLIMTATPIPRSLALTVYGDLETSVLDEMPPGRKPIITKSIEIKKKAELYNKVAAEVKAGKQAYVLCPLIEESEKLQLSAAEQLYAQLRKAFPDLSIGLIHGSIPAAERDNLMRDFLERKIMILVATTVIEVGIDVPNASIMVIEHAERFGLSQLHQLRGRVGRGSEQSYSYLLHPTPSKLTDEAKQRIQAMVSTTDGFRIAETDLQIRGPGELTGTRQSGMAKFRVADLILDQKILEVARKEAFHYMESFRDKPAVLRDFFQKYWNNRFGLIQVG